jgi:protein phosphatase
VSLSIGFKTDVGRIRDTNQDSYVVLKGKDLADEFDALLVVADGMGGTGGDRGGEVASAVVVQTLPEAIHEFLAERNDGKNPLDPNRLLRDGIVRANYNVRTRQLEQRELSGMATTCVAALVKGNALTIGNVGDSRAYLLRDGKLRQITEDHSEVWQEVIAGNMTREEARKSRFRNRVTQGIGLRSEVKPDVETLPLAEGDTVLLCSDGLSTEVSDDQIARTLAGIPDAQEACDALLKAALRNGGADNITVVVMRYGTFTPLVQPAANGTARPEPAAVEEEDEEDTDPEQNWRTQARRQEPAAAVTAPIPDRYEEPAPDDDEDAYDDEEYDDAPRRSQRERAAEEQETLGGGGLVMVLLILLAFLAVAEGIALYIASANRKVTYSTINVASSNTPISAPLTMAPTTDKDLVYAEITTVYKQPIRDDILVMDSDNTMIVVTKEGKILRLTPQGVATPLGVLMGDSSAGRKAGDNAAKVYVALDASSNRYQSNPTTKSIDKYTIGGTRVVSDIKKGELKAPAALAVDHSGNIFVIDDHILKKIEATLSANQYEQDRNRMQSQMGNGQ